MENIIYNILGLLMLIWYGAIRWTIYTNKIKYAWAYAPINLSTAFISIIFIIPSLVMPENTKSKWMLCLGIFLLFRNIYYTIEDIIDYPTNPPEQLFNIIMDILMWGYCAFYIIKYKYLINI